MGRLRVCISIMRDVGAILRLNKAGRQHLVQDGSSISKGVDILSRVNNDINLVFFLCLENPRLCDRSAIKIVSASGRHLSSHLFLSNRESFCSCLYLFPRALTFIGICALDIDNLIFTTNIFFIYFTMRRLLIDTVSRRTFQPVSQGASRPHRPQVLGQMVATSSN
jgi:hypothetical protein